MSISAEQRKAVHARAGGCCEYCRVAESARLARFHIDHIIPLKHGGEHASDNLCLACASCNLYKGATLAAIDPLTNRLTRLFNPRLQNWFDHFAVNPDVTLHGITPEGRSTIFVLRMNETPHINQRIIEVHLGNYPCQTDR